MSLRWIRLLLAAVCLAGPAPSWAQEAPFADQLADYAVLTPAVEGRFVVASGIDLTAFLPPYFGFGDVGDRRQTKALRALVERDRYDPAARFADRLVQSLGEAGFRAVQEPIARRPAGSIQSLSWGDLPEAPRGAVMIDVTISWLCLCSDIAFSKFYPAIALRWRLLGPYEEILEPSHNLVYYHYPAHYSGKKPPTADPSPDPSSIAPRAEVSEACGYHSAKTAGDDPAVLWGCFDAAIQAATNRLVFDLKKARK